jgi:hypothetical protein
MLLFHKNKIKITCGFPGKEGGPDISEDFVVALLPDVSCCNDLFSSHFIYASNHRGLE